MKEPTPEKKLTTRYPLDVYRAMKQLAQEHNRSLNGEIVWGLRTYIKWCQAPHGERSGGT